MKRKSNISILALLVFLIGFELFGQASEGAFQDIRVTADLDTILLNRKHDAFWFGALGGLSYSYDIGQVLIPRKPVNPVEPELNPLINYDVESGNGYFLGGIFEWVPPLSFWGASLRVMLYDTWVSSARSASPLKIMQTTYQNKTSFTYITISPSGRYNFSIDGLHAFAGADVYVNLSTKPILIREHVNGVPINHDYEYEFTDVGIRFGGHIGIGYEFVIKDINQRMRLRLEPYISIHGGTALVTDNGSSWNSILARLGVAIKLGPDKITYDTLKYIPTEEPPLIVLQSLDRNSEIDFPGFDLKSFAIEGQMATVDQNIVEEEFKIEAVITQDVVALPEILKAIEENTDIALAGATKPKEKIGQAIVRKKMTENVEQRYSFPKSSTTELTKEMREYLDQVSVYLKEHPNTNLAIIGHSDDQGTFKENDRRSWLRADNVVKYLVKKGINQGRLYPQKKGSLDAIASNKTDRGRKQNRRVEIKIIPKIGRSSAQTKSKSFKRAKSSGKSNVRKKPTGKSNVRKKPKK